MCGRHCSNFVLSTCARQMLAQFANGCPTQHQATLQPSKRLSHDQEKNVSKAKSRRLRWAGTKAADLSRSQIYRYKKHGLTGTQRREECREKRSSLWLRPTDFEESPPAVVASPPPIMARTALAGDARPHTGRWQVGWLSAHEHRGSHTRGQPKGRSCAESLLKGSKRSTGTVCLPQTRARRVLARRGRRHRLLRGLPRGR